MFRDNPIEGVVIRQVKKYVDHRGWLVEVFRQDEMDPQFAPVMAYVSETRPGVARGPHEHRDQADTFGFIGPSTFKLYMWDNRAASPTYRCRMVIVIAPDQPMVVTIPPGVVHAYRNVGTSPGWVFNCPNRLFAGKGKAEEVDEIRHEDRPDNPFHLD